MDRRIAHATARFSIGRYRFEYDRRWPRWHRWSCESHAHGCGGRATAVHALLAQRCWEREWATAHA